jgi:hypothetical protein
VPFGAFHFPEIISGGIGPRSICAIAPSPLPPTINAASAIRRHKAMLSSDVPNGWPHVSTGADGLKGADIAQPVLILKKGDNPASTGGFPAARGLV